MDQDVIGGFVVATSGQAPDVTYGKSIHTLMQYVFEWVGPRKTRVRISCEVKFGKGGPPGFIASQIAAGSKKGGRQASEALIELLNAAASGGGKRKKKKKNQGSGMLMTILKCTIGIALLAVLIAYGWKHVVPTQWKDQSERIVVHDGLPAHIEGDVKQQEIEVDVEGNVKKQEVKIEASVPVPKVVKQQKKKWNPKIEDPMAKENRKKKKRIVKIKHTRKPPLNP